MSERKSHLLRADDLARRSLRGRPRSLVLRASSLVLVFVLAATAAEAANNFSAKKKIADLPAVTEPLQTMTIGEKLMYEVSWMGIPVGIGELWVKEMIVKDSREAIHVVAVARTNDFLSKIYPLTDEIHSWLDANTLQVLSFEKKVSEGFYRAHERVVYDESRRKGYYESLKNGSKKEFDIHVPAHDVVSAFFWVRRQPLKPGNSFSTVVNNGEKDYDLKVKVLSRQIKEIRGMGSPDLFLLEPRTELKGVLEKRGRVWIYLSNTPERVPVLIQFKTPFGPIVGVLTAGD